MKRRLMIFLVFGIVLLGLSGCGIENEFTIGDKSDVIIDNPYIVLTIEEDTLTNTGATLILENNSNVNIIYDNSYELEIKQDDEWYKIDVQLDFDIETYNLNSSEYIELTVSWENGYGALADGEYRLLKGIYTLDEDDSYESFYTAVEFTIE